MITIIPMTRDEKIAMYMKVNKRELAEMLVNANAAIEMMGPQISSQSLQEVPRDPFHPPFEITCIANGRMKIS